LRIETVAGSMPGWLLLCVLALGHSICGASGPFTSHDNRLFDSFGREVLFHGVNVIYKSAPYIPITHHFDGNRSFVEQDAALLEELGLNVVRLGTQWPGIEPSRGNYSAEYVSQLLEIVQLCAKHNITVFLDMHQDCFSERFCGEGVPLWVAESDPALADSFPEPLRGMSKWPVGDRGVPTLEQCGALNWGAYQFTYAAAEGYDRLYRNADGLSDAFANAWAYVAAAFRGQSNVLAIELFNEPFAGNYFKDPLLMYPGHADKERLQPFYDYVSPTIRQADPERLIMFEPCTWSDEFGAKIFESGFEHAPGGPDQSGMSILSYHFYTNVNKGDPVKYFEARQRDMSRLNTSGFVTELSYSTDFDLLDQFRQSWCVWEYKSFLPTMDETPLTPVCTGCSADLWPNGVYDPDVARNISRTFPHAIQGRLLSLHFNTHTDYFNMSYTADPTVSAPTRIYLNAKLRYPGGATVKVSASPATGVTHSMDGPNFVEVVASGSGEVVVEIQRHS